MVGEDHDDLGRRVRLCLAATALPLVVLAPAFAVDPITYMNDGERGRPHLAMVRALIGGGDYPAAVEALGPIPADDPEDVEALSIMGFSQRRSGNQQAAFGYYNRVLALDPEHLGANEYLGELHVETGELALANERLAVLEVACGTDCSEYKELAAVIAAAQQRSVAQPGSRFSRRRSRIFSSRSSLTASLPIQRAVLPG